LACLFSTLVLAVDVKTYIPTNAYSLLPVVKEEVDIYMPNTPSYGYFGSLIEQESCISLTHSKCWKPTSELKTKREQGVGVGQVTRAYNADGSIRFDKLTELKTQYKAQLKEMSWLTIKERPDLQIRAIVLMTNEAYKALPEVTDEMERLAMADAIYNGGKGGLNKERTTCGLKAKCDPKIWFKNVELNCMKSKKPIYGNRSACDINREHVTNAIQVRRAKYEKYYKASK